jgi:hypothetical protein
VIEGWSGRDEVGEMKWGGWQGGGDERGGRYGCEKKSTVSAPCASPTIAFRTRDNVPCSVNKQATGVDLPWRLYLRGYLCTETVELAGRLPEELRTCEGNPHRSVSRT